MYDLEPNVSGHKLDPQARVGTTDRDPVSEIEDEPIQVPPVYQIPALFLTQNVRTPAEVHDWCARIPSSNPIFLEDATDYLRDKEVHNSAQLDEKDGVPTYQLSRDKLLELQDITAAAFVRNEQGNFSPFKPNVGLHSSSEEHLEFFV